jgi:hypothetical protein
LEQLIAESTGKEGKGIIPVNHEALLPPEGYGNDRIFVYVRLSGNATYDDMVEALSESGHPVIWIHLKDLYDLGGEFFRWEMATAVAGHQMGINPFDQPNVESAKAMARQMLALYKEQGKLPEPAPTLSEDHITVYADQGARSPDEAFRRLLSDADPGDALGRGRSYVALQAYLRPTDESDDALGVLRKKIQGTTKLATTMGYGPRFLHSTGQLHKGDGGHGRFIQFTDDPIRDVAIPDEPGRAASSITFGALKMAQALGDGRALRDAGRKVIRFHLGKHVKEGLGRLANAV